MYNMKQLSNTYTQCSTYNPNNNITSNIKGSFVLESVSLEKQFEGNCTFELY